jgi:hypothetical protein
MPAPGAGAGTATGYGSGGGSGNIAPPQYIIGPRGERIVNPAWNAWMAAHQPPPPAQGSGQGGGVGIPPQAGIGTAPPGTKGGTPATNLTNPNAGNPPAVDPYANFAGAAGPNYAADLAEKQREFDITTQRDIAKQAGTEVDALQSRLAALSGPKDAYADYFFAHGLLPPQGYKPAPVPLTQAQIDAYGRMGTTPQQLQDMIAGTGKPGADMGMLGSMAPSMATPAGLPQPNQGAPPVGPQTANNPTLPAAQGGAGVQAPPPPVPSMAAGGPVPGPPGTPSLAVVHGGEQVTPSDQPPQMPPGQSQGAPPGQGLHPAIAALVQAVSNLLSNPDMAPFVKGTLSNQDATAGGVPSMAAGGMVPPPSGTSSVSAPPTQTSPSEGQREGPPGRAFSMPNPGRASSMPNPGLAPPGVRGGAGGAALRGTNPWNTSLGGISKEPGFRAPLAATGGAQGVISNTGAPGPADNPVMPIANMDPYTRALYDINGRLKPYSAQQERDMGPQGLAAVNSYMGKVQGGDVAAYTDLVNRLKPQGSAPTASTGTATEGFSFG